MHCCKIYSHRVAVCLKFLPCFLALHSYTVIIPKKKNFVFRMTANGATTKLAWIDTVDQQHQDQGLTCRLVTDHLPLCHLIDLIVANIIPENRHILYIQCKGQWICHHPLDLHHHQ